MELRLKLANSIESILEKVDVSNQNTISDIYRHIESSYGLDKSEYVLLTKNGTKINAKSVINNFDVIQLSPLVLGGKGGFGSLLRSFGKQITKSTNKEACRDLTGRRIRHVNNEKKLKDFLSKQSELAKKKEEEKKNKMEQKKKKREKLESSHHLFVDPKYDEQKQKIAEDLEHAISSAICSKKSNNLENSENGNDSKDNAGSSSNGEDNEKVSKKSETKDDEKFKSWLGIDDVDVSSSDDDEDQEPAKKIKLK